MKAMQPLLASLLLILLSACSTMKFVNGPKMEETVAREQWHHLALFDAVEMSVPLDLNYYCHRQQWDSITIERSFLNGVASASWPLMSLYTPWTITYECRDSIDE